MSRGHDPEYSLVHAVGLCVLNWARVEVLLADLFHTVLKQQTPEESMLDRIPAFSTRLSVIDAAIEHAALPSATTARWAKVKESVLEKHARRNAIVGSGVKSERLDPRSSRAINVRQLPVGTLLKRDKSMHLSDLDAAANSFQRLAEEIANLQSEIQSAYLTRFVDEARGSLGNQPA